MHFYFCSDVSLSLPILRCFWLSQLIGPYALGVLPIKNGLAEPIYSHVEDQYIRPPDSTAKSSSVLMSRHQSMESTISMS